MLKQTLIATAAIALAAVPAFASYHHSNGGSFTIDSFNTKTVTVTKAEVNNTAEVNNMVFTASNTGLNYTSANGGVNTADTTSGEAEKGGTTGDTTGASMLGGAA